jgi:glycine cleavage system H lipoate-binding protein
MKPQAQKKHCVWMEAGVIDYKICDNNYDCNSCKFDGSMKKTAAANLTLLKAGEVPRGKKGKIIPWQDKMRQRSGLQQQCRHMLTHRVPVYFCGNNYDCFKCPFDQMLEDQFELFAPPLRPHLQDVFGIAVPTSAYLHKGHTWIAVENGGRLRIGLDEFSQRVLGPADEVELPKVGEVFRQNATGLALARQGHTAPVLAPVDGIIEAVNQDVRKHPQVIHDHPYEEGWLFVVTPTQLKANLEKLLFGEKNLAWIQYESHKLLGLLETNAGVTLPDGGAVVDDVYGHFPEIGWDNLVRQFMRTR